MSVPIFSYCFNLTLTKHVTIYEECLHTILQPGRLKEQVSSPSVVIRIVRVRKNLHMQYSSVFANEETALCCQLQVYFSLYIATPCCTITLNFVCFSFISPRRENNP